MTDFCDQTANAGVYVRHVRGVNLGTWYYRNTVGSLLKYRANEDGMLNQ